MGEDQQAGNGWKKNNETKIYWWAGVLAVFRDRFWVPIRRRHNYIMLYRILEADFVSGVIRAWAFLCPNYGNLKYSLL